MKKYKFRYIPPVNYPRDMLSIFQRLWLDHHMYKLLRKYPGDKKIYISKHPEVITFLTSLFLAYEKTTFGCMDLFTKGRPGIYDGTPFKIRKETAEDLRTAIKIAKEKYGFPADFKVPLNSSGRKPTLDDQLDLTDWYGHWTWSAVDMSYKTVNAMTGGKWPRWCDAMEKAGLECPWNFGYDPRVPKRDKNGLPLFEWWHWRAKC